MFSYKKSTGAVAATALIALFHPSSAAACACGCAVFGVSTPDMLPSGAGGTLSLEYDFMNQNKNWNGSSSAPAANNSDKRIRTDFFTLGGQYMFNRAWGVNVQVPYWERGFDTDTGGGDVEGYNHGAWGDVSVSGLYTGFSPDMSTGLEFGLKLPTGDYTYANFDRDTEIGTGSTDALLGVFHRDRFAAAPQYIWSLHGKIDLPMMTRGDYRPGNEFDASAGVAHDPVKLVENVRVAPFFKLIDTYRMHDRGVGDPENSGYERVLVSPGLEFSRGAETLDADVGVPVYQRTNGNQLVAPVFFQVVLSHAF
ncbi:MAG: hypothetical protein KGL10_05185 [Alphaproteobacteria bacterium]|nr:hypothetical protein [Alphaproteobacteria bacterium]MDE2336686.1 hypothetical protein [Alphaproteobacteria bacterium]